MTLDEIFDKLDKLKEYMNIRIQLLKYCHPMFGSLWVSQIPSFEHFLETYDDEYSMRKECFKESIDFRWDDPKRITKVYTAGLGTRDGVAHRHYNSLHGCRYYPTTDDFKIDTDYMNSHLKSIDRKL